MVGTVIAGCLLRVYQMDNKICWLDEAYTMLRISGFTVEEILVESANGGISRMGDFLKFQGLSKQKEAASTVYSCAIENPHSPPLYYLLERQWCNWFGSSVFTVRSLSAIFSMLCLPLVYVLCIQLFGCRAIATINTTLMALSPIQVLYAQEARPYSFWCLAILLMCVTLLKAVQSGRTWWLIYALSSAFALWVHPLSIFVLAAHALYLGVLAAKNKSWQNIPAFSLSALGGLIIFSPWIYVMVLGLETIRARLSSTVNRQGDWIFDISYPFIDLPTTEFFAILAFAIPAMQLIAMAALVFTKKRKPFLFLACLGLIPTLSVLTPDLFLGGLHSFIPRYLFPLYLSLVLSMGFLIDTLINAKKNWQVIIGAVFFAMLWIIGLRSDWLMLQETTWWNKEHSNYLMPLAGKINKAQKPYLYSAAGVGTMLVLSHLLKPEIPVQLLDRKIESLPAGASDIFLLNPPPDLIISLRSRNICKMAPLDPMGRLWKLEPTVNSSH